MCDIFNVQISLTIFIQMLNARLAEVYLALPTELMMSRYGSRANKRNVSELVDVDSVAKAAAA